MDRDTDGEMDRTHAVPQPLTGKIALVAGATRGAGRAMAVELGRAGATVYATGRTTRAHTSEVGRTTETIEETAELITAAGREAGGTGTGIAVPTDHLEPEQVDWGGGRHGRPPGRPGKQGKHRRGGGVQRGVGQ
ncbi:hypothetical protein ACFWVL_43590, partial [Streptomyces sp. NPDC058644]